MIGTTIGAILDGECIGLDPSHRLYVVRDGATVFYVGQSRDPVERLLGHMGHGAWVFYGKSSLGRMVEVNMPASQSWQVELLTITECGACDVADAEQALIDLHTPHLNIKGKRRRSGALPNCYKVPGARVANQGVVLE